MPYKDPEIRRAYMREYQRTKRDVAKQLGYKLKHRYGLTIEEWEALFESQGRSCAICRVPDQPNQIRAQWHTNHNHETGKVRGILCSTCNRGLGQFQDSPELMRQAALYIEVGGDAKC